MELTLDAITVMVGEKGRRRPAVADVGLAARAGTVTVVMGPSGSGKSTLLAVLGLLLRPHQGAVRWDGRAVPSDDRQRASLRLRKIGFMFQGANLLSSCTALENVTLPGRIAGSSVQTVTPKAVALLEQLGVRQQASQRVVELSGGEAQRVALCRALINEPAVLIADEPTASLDRESREIVVRELATAARERNCAVILATHDERVVEIGDSLLRLMDGRIVQ